jgi:hypothetical protein
VPPHNASSSPYAYNCHKIKSGYDFCYDDCDMCFKNRSTSIIEAAIDKAAQLGYTEQVTASLFHSSHQIRRFTKAGSDRT